MEVVRAVAPTRAVPTGLLLVGAAALLWALIGVFTPSLLRNGMDAVEIGFWRALGGGLLFTAHAAVCRRLGAGSSAQAGRLVAFGIVAVGVFYVALAQAIDLGGVSLAWILLYTAPAWVAIGAVTVLRERVDRRRAALVTVTVGGVVLVALGGGTGVRVSPASLAWGMAAGLSYASWYVAGKQLLARHDPLTISAWTLLAGAAVILPFAAPGAHPPRVWALVVGLVVVSTYAPVLLYYTGLRSVEASRAAIVATVEPVGALLIGATVGAERLTVVAVAGAGLVLAAAVAAALPARRVGAAAGHDASGSSASSRSG